MSSRRFPLKAGLDGTQQHREKMTQLAVPPPYSLVLLIQVKTPNSSFGEPSSLHLDSFLLLPRERSCKFAGERCQMTAWLHTWEANARRGKGSLSLPPAWEREREQPLELQRQQMWHEQSPSWS